MGWTTESSAVLWEEMFWHNVFWIQIGCLALAACILVSLFLVKFVHYRGLWSKVREWGFSHVRSLHGELCRCVFCDELDELHHRVEELERRYESLAADLSPTKSLRESEAKISPDESAVMHFLNSAPDAAFADGGRELDRKP